MNRPQQSILTPHIFQRSICKFLNTAGTRSRMPLGVPQTFDKRFLNDHELRKLASLVSRLN